VQCGLQKPDTRGHRLLRGHLVAAKRQIGDHEGPLGRTCKCLAKRKQFVVGSQIANEEHLKTRLVEDLRGLLIVSREHGEMLPVGLGLLQVMGPDPARRLLPIRTRKTGPGETLSVGSWNFGGGA
jgi:hypothetical protein